MIVLREFGRPHMTIKYRIVTPWFLPWFQQVTMCPIMFELNGRLTTYCLQITYNEERRCKGAIIFAGHSSPFFPPSAVRPARPFSFFNETRTKNCREPIGRCNIFPRPVTANVIALSAASSVSFFLWAFVFRKRTCIPMALVSPSKGCLKDPPISFCSRTITECLFQLAFYRFSIFDAVFFR